MNLTHPFFPAHTRLNKNIGASMPKDPLAKAINAEQVPLPSQVQGDDAAITQAEHDVAQQALLKKSIRSTVIAGDTGGWRPGATQ